MNTAPSIEVSAKEFSARAAMVGAEPPRVAAEEKGGKKARKVRARKDGSGQEKAWNMEPIKTKMDHMVSRYNHMKEAANDFSETVKAVAKDSGFNTAAVRQFVVAKAGEKFEERKRYFEQLSLLFETGE